MRLKYDLSVGALYIRLSHYAVARTVEIDDNTNVDVDDLGQPVGIEVISVAHPWPLETLIKRFGISGADEAQLLAYFRGSAPRAPSRDLRPQLHVPQVTSEVPAAEEVCVA
jgi:uncharacterized protein YuzE